MLQDRRDAVMQSPRFEHVLRYLVTTEGWSLSDVAVMFGVSRERVRQWCVRRQIVPSARATRRIWDDARHRFVGCTAREYAAARTAARRAAHVAHRRMLQRQIIDILQTLARTIGRAPTWHEMYLALGGDPDIHRGTAAARVLAMWDSSSRSIKEKLRDFRAATRLKARARGRPGWTA